VNPKELVSDELIAHLHSRKGFQVRRANIDTLFLSLCIHLLGDRSLQRRYHVTYP
jgi:hypothetical protein